MTKTSIDPKIWDVAKTEMQMQSSPAFYASCLKKMYVSEYKPGPTKDKLKLAIPNFFWKQEILKKYQPTFTEIFNRLLDRSVEIDYVITSKPAKETPITQEEAPLFANNQTSIDEDLFQQLLQKHRLEPERNLDSFAVSSSNEMAFAAANAVANRPGSAYNPLFLHGGVGVGKTHLMQGIGQALLKANLDTKIIYCSGEEFTNEIIDAIRKKSTSRFRSKYRTVQLLLIDDIQFIAGKNSVQEEFFHTFNAITAAGGQVIMTSDQPPKEIDSLEDRLRSRFEGGLTIDIGKPNFELRCAIIYIKAEQHHIQISPEVVQLIANLETDTRALVGKLVTLNTLATQRKQAITVELASEILDEEDELEQAPILTQDRILKCVIEYYNQPLESVLGKRRNKEYAHPRHIAMYLLNTDLGKSLNSIGQTFSNRDHTSVMHAVKKVTKLLQTDARVKQEITAIRHRL